MRARVQKWGNSLAVRIPKNLAQEAGLSSESRVELTLVEGRLVVEPVAEEVPSLEELLAQITPENRHAEVDWGAPVGKEVW
jgi:antitoxin MazE